MSLRKTTFLTVAAVLSSFIALSFLVSWLTMNSRFTRFENRMILRHVDRAVSILRNEQAAMRSTARDWGRWYDTRAFVPDLDPASIDEKLSAACLTNLRINFVVFYDASGRVECAKGVNLEAGEEAGVSADLLDRLPQPHVIPSDPAGAFAGLVALREGVALVAGTSIGKTDGSGPGKGTLVLGRMLTPDVVARLGKVALIDMALYPRESLPLAEEERAALGAFAEGRPRVVLPVGEDRMAGYAALEDLLGRPACLLRVVMPREVHMFRQRTWVFLLGVPILVGALATLTTLAVLEKLVLARVTRLSRGVREIADRYAASARLTADGRGDELTELASAINEMLATLEKGESRYRSVIENFHGIVFQVRPGQPPELCHGSVRHITGYTEEDLLSGAVEWSQLVHPEDRPSYQEARERLAAGCPSPSSLRYRVRRSDGQIRWVQEFARCMPADDGGVAAVQGVCYDITERVEAESALRDSLQTTADIVRTIPSGLFTYRYEPPDRLILVDANPEAERLTGIRLDEWRGKEFREIWPGENSGEILEGYLHATRTGEVFEREEFAYEDHRISGAFRIRAFRIPGDKLAVAFENITTRKRAEEERQHLEEQLHHAQKMEAIGQLAGGVAHDFNNLLSGILGYASLLKLEAGEDSGVREAAQTIEQAAERAAELTRQLLGFARRGKLQNAPVDLHGTIEEVVRLLGRTFDKNIRITQRLRAPHAVVTGDPNQLQQVFVNLALNARDAMPEGGELAFESDLADIADTPGAAPRPHVVVTVTDQGCGIAKEHLGRIFEPFFTTKEQGKGTGMGLAMVYGIVRNHGGFVRVDSGLGAGASFRVYLPASTSEKAADAAETPTPPPVHGAARILLVDDEAVIRNMASTVLSRLGYSVVTVANGRDAVEYYAKHANEVDLVIVDMVMPEMGGQECFRSLKRINPGIRAILSSGYGFDGKASELLDEGMLGFIQKPYRVTDLSVAVSKALSVGRD